MNKEDVQLYIEHHKKDDFVFHSLIRFASAHQTTGLECARNNLDKLIRLFFRDDADSLSFFILLLT